MPVEVFSDDRLSKTDIRVLGTILSFRDKQTNVCWPSRKQISERCGIPETKISVATKRLVDLGWLIKEGSGGRSMHCNYRLTVPDLVTVYDDETVTDSVTVTDSGTKTVTDSVTGIKQTIQQTIEQTITPYSPPRKKTHPEKTKTESPSDDGLMCRSETAFDRFWDAYPKKVGKEAAHNAWKRIKKPHDILSTILQTIVWQRESEQWTKERGQFIPNPATYLNQGRWMDERPAARASPNKADGCCFDCSR